MATRVSAIAALLVLLSAGCLQQEKGVGTWVPAKAALWAGEPSSFLGIQLGADVAKQFKECDPYECLSFSALLSAPISAKEPRCICRGESSAYLTTLPDLGVDYEEVRMDLLEGRVERINVTLPASSSERFYALLQSKYGKPLRTWPRGHKFGRSNRDQLEGTAVWRGENTEIRFTDSSPSVLLSKAEIVVRTKRWAEYEAQLQAPPTPAQVRRL